LQELRDPVKNYNRFTRAQLASRYKGSIDWAARFATWKVNPGYVIVGQPEDFDALERQLAEAPPAVIRDYLKFHLISAYADRLTPALATSETTTRRFFEKFLEGGGRGEYVFVAEHSLNIGHRIASAPKLWDTKVEAFLRGLN
jgi:predicted metalloendopeptidase